jgi:WD40 repeat protein
LSPNGEFVCTLSADETLALWKLFPKKEVSKLSEF